MRKDQLTESVNETKNEIKNALQTMYDALNQGQQKKILKDEKAKAYFDLYGVNYG